MRKRWLAMGLGSMVVVLVVIGLLAWFVVVPNWRPALREGERYGVDVSAHQYEIDWSAVADDDIDLA